MSDGAQEVAEEKKQKKGSAKGLFMIVVAVILLAAGAAGGVYAAQQKPELFGLSKGNAAAQAEADRLVAEVGKVIVLPTDEKPTVATITDFTKLKDQPFFKNAKNGDKVLIYTNAKKAILFRESESRVIEVGAVNINQQTQTTVPSPVASGKPTPTVKPVIPSAAPLVQPTPTATPVANP
jgi:hypothetical protein